MVNILPSRRLWLRRLQVGCALLLAALPGRALAHDGAPHGELSGAWNWDPLIIAGMVVVGLAYVRGVRTVWGRAGFGRGISTWQAAAFGGSFLALAVALLSPLDALAEGLFAAHMGQHILLGLVAPLLLALSVAHLGVLWALPLRWRHGLGRWLHSRPAVHSAWRFLTTPLLVWGLYQAVLWGWHAPPLYQAAILNETLHKVEHASMFTAGLLYWWGILSMPQDGKAGGAFLLVFTTALASGFLGVLILFSPEPWYPLYAERALAWGLPAGLTPLEDQQIAGVLMWIPPGIIFLGAALAILKRWILKDDPETAGRETVLISSEKRPVKDSGVVHQ